MVNGRVYSHDVSLMQIYADGDCQEEEEPSLCIDVVGVGAELIDSIHMGRRIWKSSRRHSRSCQFAGSVVWNKKSPSIYAEM
jgi:hypothetical protein